MCTVTIHRAETSLLVTMNRDEARFRAAEKPPQEQLGRSNQIKWLAPIDGQAGGTWFGANEYAVQACLLNRYLPDDALSFGVSGERPSRGQIITELLERGSEHDAISWLDAHFDPKPYPSFCLIVAGPNMTHSFAWDGHLVERQTHIDSWLFFSSSSWRTREVIEYRKRAFEAWVKDGAPNDGLIPSFHLWQPPDFTQWAPLVDRQYSATRSITQTETDFMKKTTEMRYWPREQFPKTNTPFTILQLHHASS